MRQLQYPIGEFVLPPSLDHSERRDTTMAIAAAEPGVQLTVHLWLPRGAILQSPP
jgi:hypothetical protein